jgi:chromosome partitioning protein
MSRVVAVANQKGGVGKTTTALNLAACLAALERTCLLVDCDPQGNATSGMGIDREDGAPTLYEVLGKQVPMVDAVRSTQLSPLKLVPSSRNLSGIEVELLGAEDRAFRMRQAMESLRSGYEWMLLDCPPSLGIMTVNALAAADSVLVPVQCEYFALEGLGQLLETIDLVRAELNPALAIEGAVLTMYDGRTRLAQQVIREVRSHFREHVFRTVIPRNVRLSEAPSFGKPVILHDVKSPGAVSYLALAREFLRRNASAAGPSAAAPAAGPSAAARTGA